jgi:hypothetical protein
MKGRIMYADINYKTKRQLREAVADGQRIGVHQPGPFGGDEPTNGRVALEGPWFPQPHRWYATVTLVDGVIATVR